MNDEMEEIISEFITEAEESLDRIEPLFVELEQKGHDNDMLNDIFRSMHTIKGAAGFLGFQHVVDVAHSAENIMKKLREGEFGLSTQIMDAILKSIDMLRLLLDHLKENNGVEEDISAVLQALDSALKNATGEVSDTADVESTATATVHSADEAESASDNPDTPVDSEEQTTMEAQAPVQPEDVENIAADYDSAQAPEAVADSDKTEVENVKSQIKQEPEADQKTAAKSRDISQKNKDKSTQNLRVDVERLDKVMDLAGEVVLVRNRLLNLSHYFDQSYSGDTQSEVLMETVTFLDRVTSDMQLAVMKMRMQPIQKVFAKFPRLARDISASVNKEVELQIFGEGTEVDKSVIEHIGDPMTHILRNSIDHGLETADERIAKGKPAKGKIIINTFQKGNQIVIEITDDGSGIDIEKLKKKAVDKSLLTEEEAGKMSDEAATEIIFMPGFSTVEVATELSGRGVGMDVVKTNISLLNGYVEVSTQKDAGTTFRICIPLTLAIIQALMVEVSGAKYAIPLSPIEETLKVSNDEINHVTGQNVIVIRDKVCPLFELDQLLGIDTNGSSDYELDHKYIVVISLGEKRFCIAVDKLLGQEEVVIKTLDGVDTTSSYVLGATITGDGKVVFILDVTGISRNLLEIAKN
jgi:two-component system chemotaxis sensor kinase CheA